MLDAETKKKIEEEASRRKARVVEVAFHAPQGHWLVKFSTGRGEGETITETIFPKHTGATADGKEKD